MVLKVKQCPFKDCEKEIRDAKVKLYEDNTVRVFYCEHCGRPVQREQKVIWTGDKTHEEWCHTHFTYFKDC